MTSFHGLDRCDDFGIECDAAWFRVLVADGYQVVGFEMTDRHPGASFHAPSRCTLEMAKVGFHLKVQVETSGPLGLRVVNRKHERQRVKFKETLRKRFGLEYAECMVDAVLVAAREAME